MTSEFGIYIHTPWCKSRCPYCAFNVFLAHSADYTRWHDCIIAAWSSMREQFDGKAHSVYFGGGTPSLAPPGIIQRILDVLPLDSNAEVTLEANPGTISTQGLQDMRIAGINRLSIGVQTFNKEHARALGRGHTSDQARSLLKSAEDIGFDSWSMDLMFALPNQTEKELDADLDIVLDIGPPHVSIYGLTVEPSTPFHEAFLEGKLQIPEAETWRRMYDTIVHRMHASGLHRYEVSNFAQNNHRAVHNEQVWRGEHYAGLGPGAHGFLPDGHRTLGHADIDAWFSNPVPTALLPDRHDAAVDYLLSSLRHVDGASRILLRERYEFDFGARDIHQLAMKQFIYEKEGHIRLTPAGFPLADGILHKLVAGIECIKST